MKALLLITGMAVILAGCASTPPPYTYVPDYPLYYSDQPGYRSQTFVVQNEHRQVVDASPAYSRPLPPQPAVRYQTLQTYRPYPSIYPVRYIRYRVKL